MILTQDLLTLLQFPGAGRRSIQRLISRQQTNSQTDPSVFLQLLDQLKAIRPQISNNEDAVAVAQSRAESILRKCSNHCISVVGWFDDRFPALLRQMPDPPPVVFVRGDLAALSGLAIAVIGTRQPARASSRYAHRLGEILSQNDITVVSGLAIGCDTAAHKGALDASGRTVAVLAHGLDTVYPARNRALAEDITSNGGCLVSEYPPETPPQRRFFVERDRLQSGLGDGVIVVESSLKGGSMHTARFCKEQKRVLGAISGSIANHDKNRFSGNLELISSKEAMEITDADSLDWFIEQCRALRNQVEETATD
jgi:DNA processing protein